MNISSILTALLLALYWGATVLSTLVNKRIISALPYASSLSFLHQLTALSFDLVYFALVAAVSAWNVPGGSEARAKKDDRQTSETVPARKSPLRARKGNNINDETDQSDFEDVEIRILNPMKMEVQGCATARVNGTTSLPEYELQSLDSNGATSTPRFFRSPSFEDARLNPTAQALLNGVIGDDGEGNAIEEAVISTIGSSGAGLAGAPASADDSSNSGSPRTSSSSWALGRPPSSVSTVLSSPSPSSSSPSASASPSPAASPSLSDASVQDLEAPVTGRLPLDATTAARASVTHDGSVHGSVSSSLSSAWSSSSSAATKRCVSAASAHNGSDAWLRPSAIPSNADSTVGTVDESEVDGGEMSAWRVFLFALPAGAAVDLSKVLTYVSYGSISASLTHTAKASAALFTVLLTWLFHGRQLPSRLRFLSLLPITVGISLAAMSEIRFHAGGFVAALLATVSSVCQSMWSKRCLSDPAFRRSSTVRFHLYVTIVSILLLAPQFILDARDLFFSAPLSSPSSGSPSSAAAAAAASALLQPPRQPSSLSPLAPQSHAGGGGGGGEAPGEEERASLGLLLAVSVAAHYTQAIASLVVLTRLSVLALQVSNTGKRLIVIIASTLYFQIPVSALNVGGALLACIGFFLFSLSHDKPQKLQPQHQQQHHPQQDGPSGSCGTTGSGSEAHVHAHAHAQAPGARQAKHHESRSEKESVC